MNNSEQDQDPAASASILRSLINLDMKSSEFPGILSSSLNSKDFSAFLNSLCNHECLLFIDFLDMALDAITASQELFRKGFRVLRKLCGERKLLPSSHVLSEGLAKTSSEPVACGGYSDVWKGTYKGTQVAIKTLRISKRDEISTIHKQFCKEVVLWRRLSHPNIVPFLGVSSTFSELCMISEWMPQGDIVYYLKNHPKENRLELLRQVAMGLEYLHSREVVHGDLKGHNVVVDGSGCPRLCDFGLASLTVDFNSINASSARTVQGTIQYMAPELLISSGSSNLKSSHPTIASDIYAFAMVVIEVFTGEPPFPRVRPEVVIGLILRDRRPPRPKESRKLGLSDNVWNMVEACWSKDPSLRPTISEVVTCLDNAVATFVDEVSWTFVASSSQKASSTAHPSSPPLLPKLVSEPKHGLSLVSSSSPCMTTPPLQKPNAFLPNGKPTNGLLLLQKSSTTFCPSTSKTNLPPHSAASHSQKLDPVAISRPMHVNLGPSQPVNSRTPKASRNPTSVNPKNIPRHRSGDVPTVSKFATLQHDSSVDSFVVVNPTDYQDSQDLPENCRSARKCIIQ